MQRRLLQTSQTYTGLNALICTFTSSVQGWGGPGPGLSPGSFAVDSNPSTYWHAPNSRVADSMRRVDVAGLALASTISEVPATPEGGCGGTPKCSQPQPRRPVLRRSTNGETVGARITVAFRAGNLWLNGVGVLPTARREACAQVSEWEVKVKDETFTVRFGGLRLAH